MEYNNAEEAKVIDTVRMKIITLRLIAPINPVNSNGFDEVQLRRTMAVVLFSCFFLLLLHVPIRSLYCRQFFPLSSLDDDKGMRNAPTAFHLLRRAKTIDDEQPHLLLLMLGTQ